MAVAFLRHLRAHAALGAALVLALVCAHCYPDYHGTADDAASGETEPPHVGTGVGLGGARTTSSDPTPSTLPPLNAVCQDACDHGDEDDWHWAVCYSCKCKQAIGALPSQLEATCAAGKDIHVYTAKLQGGVVVEHDEPNDVATCDNPALLDSLPVESACVPGGKLGQGSLPNGAVYKFVCRRKVGIPRDAPPVYIDYGIIVHNPHNGATCYWAGTQPEIDGQLPPIDLSDGDPDKIIAYTNGWGVSDGRAEGDDCIGCHDNDPFMYSPHLKSVFDFDESAHRYSPYARVHVNGPPTAVGHKALVSPEAAPCTACHRITDGDTCDRWATISSGAPEVTPVARPYQPAIVKHPALYAAVARWMPHPMPDGTTRASWEATYGAARDHIQRCCADRTRAECQWQDVTGYTGDPPP